jgi:hypothetical protein
VQPQRHGVRPLLVVPLDDRLADAEGTLDDEQRFPLVPPDLHAVVLALGRDLEGGRRIAVIGPGQGGQQANHEQEQPRLHRFLPHPS